MSLSPGVRLGAYEIVSLVGAGGMGEIYRARDTRLDRTVAIKVLAASLAADAQLARARQLGGQPIRERVRLAGWRAAVRPRRFIP